MVFLGVDIGTSGCKCAAFSEDGAAIAASSFEYPVNKNAELRGEDLFSYVRSAISRTAAALPEVNGGVSIAISSFGESFVPMDINGNALAPVGMYNEGRGFYESELLKRNIPSIARIVGAKPNPLYAFPRIMRLLDNVPEIRKNVWKFLQIADYVIYKLCGETVIDYPLACRALAFDVLSLKWSETILAEASLTPEHFPEPVPPGSIAGLIRGDLADELALPRDTRIITGAHDQVAAAVGAGVLKAGEAVVGTGSVECITPVFGRPILDDGFLDKNYVCIPHAAGGLYVTYAFTKSGGSLLAWFRDSVAYFMKPAAAERNINVYELLNEICPNETSGVFVVPHFGGTGTPELDPNSAGTITGLGTKTGLPEIYRAILEGLCFEMRYNKEQIGEFGIGFDTLRATGGGAKSPLWLQMKADIINVPVTSLETADAGVTGGAMLAAVNAGAFRDLSEAAEVFVKINKTYLPDSEAAGMYDEKYHRYKKIRDAMT